MRIPLFFSILILLLASCSSSTESETISPAKPGKAMPELEAKAKLSRRAYTAEELNRPYSTVSPWRYIYTSPEAQYFKKMVTVSSHSRVVHSAGHAVLVPRDETFKDNKTWKGIMEKENLAVLDRFVGAHIIKGIEGPKELEGVYEDLNGNTIVIETAKDGEQVCGGARLLGQVVETDNGVVIPVMGMVEDIRWD